MNPCDVCGDRILDYPGVCASCLIERKDLRKRTQRTYAANTASHEGDRYSFSSSRHGKKLKSDKKRDR
jgi:hypothetical protein